MSTLDDSALIDRARALIEAEGRAVVATLGALDNAFVNIARLFAACTGKILVTGSGTSGTIASRAAHLFSFCGTPAFFLSPADGLHGGLGVLQPNDLVLALSKEGSSEELNDFCRRARSLCSGIVAVTASPQSALATSSDHVISLKLDEDADLGTVVATGSSLAMAALVDALVEVARVSRGLSWDDMLFMHPSGGVGRDARQRLENRSMLKGSAARPA